MYKLPTEQHPTDTWSIITESARTNRVIAIRYRDKSHEISERLIEPYEIKNGKLFAFCLTRNGMRAFILNNILASAESENSYVPRFPVAMDSFQYFR